MLFARSYRLTTTKSVDHIKSALIGRQFKVHNLDFEIYERDKFIKIIPHAEMEKNIKTLPITHLELEGKGDTTNVKVSYKIRKLDQGGPYLIMLFCLFLAVGAVLFYFMGGPAYDGFTYTMAAVCILLFAGFWIKMQTGYFDYNNKIKAYIKENLASQN